MRKIPLRRIIFGLVAAILGATLAIGVYLFWYSHRPLPAAFVDQPLFVGVTYTREVRREPRPMIVHVVKIDLTAPGIGFLVTPQDEREDAYPYSARSVSQFLEAHGLQLAINGDFFRPWRDNGPLDYYPHEGDGVDVNGLAASRGEIITTGYGAQESYHVLYISKANRVSFDKPEGEVYHAIAGNWMIVVEGLIQRPDVPHPYYTSAQPRTAVALDATGEMLLFFIIDGRQPNYSEGAGIDELAAIILEHGGYTALNLDRGGSAVLVIADENGHPLPLSSAIHNRIPANERPIANHLGVYARPL